MNQRSVADDEGFPGCVDDLGSERIEMVERLDAADLGEKPGHQWENSPAFPQVRSYSSDEEFLSDETKAQVSYMHFRPAHDVGIHQENMSVRRHLLPRR